MLNANTWVPPSHLLVADVMMPFCADIENATSGPREVQPAAEGGGRRAADFRRRQGRPRRHLVHVHGYTPGRFALTDVVEFPFMGDTSEAISVAYQRIYERMLAKYDEHKGVHVLAVFTHGPGQIYNTKRPVTSLKDLDGLKIRVGGGMVNEIAKVLGTVPMLKPAPESYELLSQGVADGLFFPKESAFSFKLVPLIKHVTYVPGGLYNVSFAMIMNPAKWNADFGGGPRGDQQALGRGAGTARRQGLGRGRCHAARRRCATPISRS